MEKKSLVYLEINWSFTLNYILPRNPPNTTQKEPW